MRLFICLLFIITPISAQTLDWSNVVWNDGDLSNTFYNVDNSNVDVTFNISGGTILLEDNSPKITNEFLNSDSLFLLMDSDRRNKFITVDITFSQNINSLTLGLLDVDSGSGKYGNLSFQDKIDGIFVNDGTFSITTGSTNFLVGNTVYGYAKNPSYFNGGNVGIDFTGNFNHVRFNYVAGEFSRNNPAQQAIGIDDLVFYIEPPIVPEPNQIFMLLGLIFAAVFYNKYLK